MVVRIPIQTNFCHTVHKAGIIQCQIITVFWWYICGSVLTLPTLIYYVFFEKTIFYGIPHFSFANLSNFECKCVEGEQVCSRVIDSLLVYVYSTDCVFNIA